MYVRDSVNNVLFYLLLFWFSHSLYLLERPLAAIARKARSYYLSFYWTPRALTGTRIRTSALAAQRQTTSVTDTPVRTQIHQTLDVHRRLTTQITFNCKRSDCGAQLHNLGLSQILDLDVRGYSCRLANLLRA